MLRGFTAKNGLHYRAGARSVSVMVGKNALKAADIFPIAQKTKYQDFPSRRSVVHSTNGIVASTEPLACQAGVRILQQGGNAAVGPHHQTSQRYLSK